MPTVQLSDIVAQLGGELCGDPTLTIERIGPLQGADAGLYENSDIWGVRILVLEPVSDVVAKKAGHFALGSNAEERADLTFGASMGKALHGAR